VRSIQQLRARHFGYDPRDTRAAEVIFGTVGVVLNGEGVQKWWQELDKLLIEEETKREERT
jgi:hypothetical protein